MTPEQADALRKPFPTDVIGKLPRVWCRACGEAKKHNGGTCDKHAKVKCGDCRNNITVAHMHLDYVGHAETTDRFLSVDPEWSWEPLAFNNAGLPQLDEFGGLWIRLTIAGVTRLGYGAADGKKGPDAVKEVIGDALRNAGMRFGVALDLWGAKFKEDGEQAPGEESQADAWETATPARPAEARPAAASPSKRAVELFELATTASNVDLLKAAWDSAQDALKAGQITGNEANQIGAHVKTLRDKMQAKTPAPATEQPKKAAAGKSNGARVAAGAS